MLPDCPPSTPFSVRRHSGTAFGRVSHRRSTCWRRRTVVQSDRRRRNEASKVVWIGFFFSSIFQQSFWLDKGSGKKCYMLAARQLSIASSDFPNCWIWTQTPESRFTEVAELISVSLLEIIGKINTSIFSPDTTYVALLVFKTTSKAYGFEYQPVKVCIGFHGDRSQTRMVYLDPEAGRRRGLRSRRGIGMFSKGGFANWDVVPPPSKENGLKQRDDGWFEIEIGEYFNGGGDAAEVEVNGGNWKTGLVIQGIEFRPKKFC
ncbi:unnamed protein product [Lactuca virosa]|uniref:F-box domain-containing protein n=1 Tax=Lactuca virosa TaxID=75947 RepID=A0AAU9NDJ9_9ASTR|nr:unnamed protein product [Lactuca virosa]